MVKPNEFLEKPKETHYRTLFYVVLTATVGVALLLYGIYCLFMHAHSSIPSLSMGCIFIGCSLFMLSSYYQERQVEEVEELFETSVFKLQKLNYTKPDQTIKR